MKKESNNVPHEKEKEENWLKKKGKKKKMYQ
jgi:hypothetical protein